MDAIEWLQNLFGQTISDVVGSILAFIIKLFSGMNIHGAAEAINGILKYIRAACCFLPMGAVKGIFAVILAIWSIRLTIKAIKTLWELIPLA